MTKASGILGESRTRTPASPVPTLEHLLLEAALYSKFVMDESWGDLYRRAFGKRFQIDAYCIACEINAVFKHQSGYDRYETEQHLTNNAYLDISCGCARCGQAYSFAFVQKGPTLIKYGQYPSIEDLIGADLRRFRNVLDEHYLSELKRATGLFSHGIGIGSYVYLRRIFEHLVEEHRQKYESATQAIPDYEKMRMVEKVEALKSVLPPAVWKFKAIYGILSKGVHELAENECRMHFPVLRAAIITILEQDLQARQAELAEKELEKRLSEISGELGKG